MGHTAKGEVGRTLARPTQFSRTEVMRIRVFLRRTEDKSERGPVRVTFRFLSFVSFLFLSAASVRTVHFARPSSHNHPRPIARSPARPRQVRGRARRLRREPQGRALVLGVGDGARGGPAAEAAAVLVGQQPRASVRVRGGRPERGPPVGHQQGGARGRVSHRFHLVSEESEAAYACVCLGRSGVGGRGGGGVAFSRRCLEGFGGVGLRDVDGLAPPLCTLKNVI